MNLVVQRRETSDAVVDLALNLPQPRFQLRLLHCLQLDQPPLLLPDLVLELIILLLQHLIALSPPIHLAALLPVILLQPAILPFQLLFFHRQVAGMPGQHLVLAAQALDLRVELGQLILQRLMSKLQGALFLL